MEDIDSEKKVRFAVEHRENFKLVKNNYWPSTVKRFLLSAISYALPQGGYLYISSIFCETVFFIAKYLTKTIVRTINSSYTSAMQLNQ